MICCAVNKLDRDVKNPASFSGGPGGFESRLKNGCPDRILVLFHSSSTDAGLVPYNRPLRFLPDRFQFIQNLPTIQRYINWVVQKVSSKSKA
jgi:hypothetical protein